MLGPELPSEVPAAQLGTRARRRLGAASGLLSLVFGWAAWVLPWRPEAPLALLLWAVAAAHLCTAAAACWPAKLPRALRVASLLSLGAALILSWSIVQTSVQMVKTYGPLGEGLAVALSAIGALTLIGTVPFGVLGLSLTRARRHGGS